MTEDEFDFCKYCDELPIITIEGDREGDTAYIAGCSCQPDVYETGPCYTLEDCRDEWNAMQRE